MHRAGLNAASLLRVQAAGEGCPQSVIAVSLPRGIGALTEVPLELTCPGDMPMLRTALALALLVPLATAEDFVVHHGQSVQAAIDAAADGDRVLVQPGLYHETIAFGGKAIEVIGVAGAKLTVLDATGIGGSVVRFDSGEGRLSVLQGFTVRGGTGSDVADGPQGVGGGVLCISAAPTLRDCSIEHNSAVSSGGGLYFTGETPEAALLDHCTILDNQVTLALPGGGGGGGVHTSRTGLVMLDCAVSGNTAWDSGGGVTISQAPAQLLRCTISDNAVRHAAGGLEIEVSPQTDVLVRDCVLHHNRAGVPAAQFAPYGVGGAMTVEVGDASGGSVVLQGTIVRDNFANDSPGIDYWIFGSTPPAGTILAIDHCTFSGNVFDGNSSGGTGLDASTLLPASASTGVVVRNSVFWGVQPGARAISPFPIPPFLTALPDVQACDVQGGYVGAGNFSADPQFVEAAAGDLHLKATSPCVEHGTLTATTPEADFEGDPLPSGALPDLGADEFHAHLYVSGTPAAGELLHLRLIGPPGPSPTLIFLGAQLLDPPIVTAKGVFEVDPLFQLEDALGRADGLLDLPAVVPAGLTPGLTAWMQACTHGALTQTASVVFE